MAIPAVNLSYIGQGPTAGGVITGNNQGGPLGKTLIAMGTATLDGALTTFTVNWLDGVQKPFGKLIVLPLVAVATSAGGNAVYSSSNAATSIPVGTSVTVAGFSTGANNGTFTVQAVGSSQFNPTITLNNGSAVAETNPAATISATVGGTPIAVAIDRASNSISGVADTAAFTIVPDSVSALTATGGTITISAAGSNGNLFSFLVYIFFAS